MVPLAAFSGSGFIGKKSPECKIKNSVLLFKQCSSLGESPLVSFAVMNACSGKFTSNNRKFAND